MSEVLSLYEILKASKTGIAPDMWTALAGMNWSGADSGHKVKELTGIPPLSIRSNGTMLLDYLISGNTVQNGIPTPSNPVDVNGVGVRTKNLLKNDAVSTEFQSVQYTVNADKSVTVYGTASPRISYLVLMGNGAATNDLNAYTTPIFKAGDTLKFLSSSARLKLQGRNTDGTYRNNLDGEVTLSKDIGLIYIQVVENTTADETVYPMITLSSETDTDYEPYGYKIPISSGGVTTNIYLGSTQTVRQIYKFVLTGNEVYTYESAYSRFGFPARNMKFEGIRTTPLLCTHYDVIDDGSSIENVPNNAIYAGGSVSSPSLYIKTDAYTTETDLKAYLAQQYANGTPVTIWYVLATAETATVNEPLMKIGDYADTVNYEQAGVQIPTLHGQTVIDVETTLKPSEMYIKYQE